jgi:hypothetical protein
MKVYIFSIHNLETVHYHDIDTSDMLVTIHFSLEGLIFQVKSSVPGFCFSAEVSAGTHFYYWDLTTEDISSIVIKYDDLTNLVYLGKLYPVSDVENTIQNRLDRFEPREDLKGVCKLDLILED